MNGQDRSSGPQQRRDAVRSAAGEIREYALGNLSEVEHSDLSPAAGLFHDEDQRDLMVFAEQAYNKRKDPDDPPFWETTWAKERKERAASTAATRAVREGNLSMMEYLTGMPEYESDVSGLHALQDLEHWLLDSEKCKIAYIASTMGRGKTEFVHLCADVIEFRSERRDDLADAEFAANIPTSDMETVTDWQTFKEWVEKGSVEENRWFFFDEGSQALTGYSQDREEVEKLMSRLVKLARKFGVNIVIIGHTGMDLHADLRRLADYVTKPSLKTARIYASVKRGEGQGHLMDLAGLPKARNWGFETDDEAPWSWGDALGDDDGEIDKDLLRHIVAKRAADLAESTQISQGDAADALSSENLEINQSMVSRAANGAYDHELRGVA